MFTGIITDIGTVLSVEKNGDTRFVIRTAFDTSTIAIGASIACAGVCLTVVETNDDWFAVDASAETLSRTTLGAWNAGTTINLERALKMGDELGGHLVSGHVDGIGKIVRRSAIGASTKFEVEIPSELMVYMAEKGSVVVDGVSLTVNNIMQNSLNLNIVSHTMSVTTLGSLAENDQVNIEVDLIARYVKRLLAK